jgi:hypothetical protein
MFSTSLTHRIAGPRPIESTELVGSLHCMVPFRIP